MHLSPRCECERCRDPTEFSSYMSALRCSRCSGFKDGEGDLQDGDLQHLVSENSLNSEASFGCEECNNSQKASQIRTGNMTIANELKELDRSRLENLTGFLVKYQPILGPTNAHTVEIKYAIVMLLGNRRSYTLENLNQEQLELKAALAKELLELATKVEPGSTRWLTSTPAPPAPGGVASCCWSCRWPRWPWLQDWRTLGR